MVKPFPLSAYTAAFALERLEYIADLSSYSSAYG
jgi:hypothetical protein